MLNFKHNIAFLIEKGSPRRDSPTFFHPLRVCTEIKLLGQLSISM